MLPNNADLRNTEFHNALMLYAVFSPRSTRPKSLLIYISGYINGYG